MTRENQKLKERKDELFEEDKKHAKEFAKMTRLMSENEKKRARAEQKIEEENHILRQKQEEVVDLAVKLEEEAQRRDFLQEKVI